MNLIADVEARIAALTARYPIDPGLEEALARKLRRRPGEPHRISELGVVQEQLQRFLTANIDAPFVIRDLRRLTGGGSKEQFIFQLSTSGRDEPAEGRKLILRLQPAESLTETSRVAEHQLMRALAQAVPIPAALWIDPDGDWFDHPAMIAEFVSGVTKPRAGPATNVTGVGTTFGPEWRKRLARPFVENLAKIHAFDWRQSDLSAFSPGKPNSTRPVETLLNWQDRVWEEDRIEPIPIVQIAGRWLREHMPVVEDPCIVHGDYRTGNFLFDEESGAITAILDWEQGRIGDYHDDLAYITHESAVGQYDADGTYLVSGLIPKAEFLALYESCSGRRVKPDVLRYYEIVHALRGTQWMLSTAIGVIERKQSHQDVLCAWIAPMGYSFMATLSSLLKEELAR